MYLQPTVNTYKPGSSKSKRKYFIVKPRKYNYHISVLRNGRWQRDQLIPGAAYTEYELRDIMTDKHDPVEGQWVDASSRDFVFIFGARFVRTTSKLSSLTQQV